MSLTRLWKCSPALPVFAIARWEGRDALTCQQPGNKRVSPLGVFLLFRCVQRGASLFSRLRTLSLSFCSSAFLLFCLPAFLFVGAHFMLFAVVLLLFALFCCG